MMNKQHLLCLSLVSLLMSPAYSSAMQRGGAPGLSDLFGGLGNKGNPIDAFLLLVAGSAVGIGGYASIESFKGMLKDIENGKKEHTSFEEDVRNCAKISAICTGSVGLGGALWRNQNTRTNMSAMFGSSVIAILIFLLLKHVGKNPSLRLREVMAAMALSGGLGALLAPNWALRF